MENKPKRGSEKVLAAWKARALSEESVKEIVSAFEKSSAVVERANVSGGSSATGLRVSLSYSGDDVPQCGNDMAFWLAWLKRHGGAPRPPRIIINGIPFPEVIKMELDFGHVDGPLDLGGLGELAGGRFGG